MAGGGGGPIEVRDPPTDGRDLDPADGTRGFEGVPVRDTAALEEALNCLVGDFVGDLAMLVGLATLGTGLGLGAFRLFLLPSPGSPALDVLPAAGLKLLGREGLRAGLGAGAWAMMVAIMGLTNMP